MVTEKKIFLFEDRFLDKEGLMSILELSDGHNLLPNDFLKRDNIEKVFINSLMYSDGEVYYDLICKLPNGSFIYLSKSDGVEYKVKLYYSADKLSEVKFFLAQLLKQKKESKNI
jgi:hypothetical protein